jgi:GNAT superfamily N-acetyltransferase
MPNESILSGMVSCVLRRLTEHEVVQDYVALRMAVLGDELRLTKAAVRSAADLLDDYDKKSRAFGCFVGSKLVGAVRLVIADRPERLPSYAFLPRGFSHWRPGRIAEVSRLVVRGPYRHFGVGTTLVAHAIRSADWSGIQNIVAGAIDRPRTIDFWGTFGFRVIRDNFYFDSSQMRYPYPMATFWLDPAARR